MSCQGKANTQIAAAAARTDGPIASGAQKFSGVKTGEFFRSYTPAVLLKTADIESMQNNFVNVETGMPGRIGPDAPVEIVESPQYRRMTDKQKGCLRDLGQSPNAAISIGAASDMIDRAKSTQLPRGAVGYCHYCGQPAESFDFFDVAVCSECQ